MSARQRLAFGALLSVAWLVAFVAWHAHSVWRVTGIVAGLSLLLLGLLDGRALAPLLAWRTRSVALGISAGLAMAGATYLLFPVGEALIPSLHGEVARLYGQLHTPPGPLRALPVLVLVVLAEELLFRGVLVKALLPFGGVAAVGGAALLYALPQLGTGSPLLISLALCCGLLWGLLRVLANDLLTPLLAHLVWDLLVFVFVPLV